MIELRKLHFNLLPLEEMVLGLLTDGGDQVKLSGHRVRLLEVRQRNSKSDQGGSAGETFEVM